MAESGGRVVLYVLAIMVTASFSLQEKIERVTVRNHKSCFLYFTVMDHCLTNHGNLELRVQHVRLCGIQFNHSHKIVRIISFAAPLLWPFFFCLLRI